jgi:catechol 2,3-dioxygenase-like lactoylglutathione lyase family enzyme
MKVLELHHHGIRIGKTAEEVEQAQQFYSEVLGLPVDAGRPNIPGIPGFWVYVGDDAHTAQIHLISGPLAGLAWAPPIRLSPAVECFAL